jgi:hypothetical protein
MRGRRVWLGGAVLLLLGAASAVALGTTGTARAYLTGVPCYRLRPHKLGAGDVPTVHAVAVSDYAEDQLQGRFAKELSEAARDWAAFGLQGKVVKG